MVRLVEKRKRRKAKSATSQQTRRERWKFINERVRAISRRNFMQPEECWHLLKWCKDLLEMAKDQKKPNRIVAIDQSYSRIGFAVVEKPNKILCAESMDLTKLKTPTSKRNAVRELTLGLIEKWQPRALVVERVRVFAGQYITEQTALMLAAMTAVIVDRATNAYNLPVYAINTQSWKKWVLGDSRAKKAEAVAYLKDNYEMTVNHDAADAVCMAVAVYAGCKVKRQQ